MKRKFLIIIMVLFVINNAKAQTCQSLFASAEKIFNGLAQDYIKFRMEAAQVFVDLIIPGKPGADAELDKLFDKATKLQIDLYKSYGVMAGETSSSIGAVKLIIPVKKWSGSCYTERTFTILQSPYDKVVIKIKKTGGKRGLKIKACVKYANGSVYDDASREIDNGKDTDGVERKITFDKNMLDKNISLHIVAFGGLPSDKGDYELSVEGFFDEEEMKKLDKENKDKPKDKKISNQPVKIEGVEQKVKTTPVNN